MTMPDPYDIVRTAVGQLSETQAQVAGRAFFARGQSETDDKIAAVFTAFGEVLISEGERQRDILRGLEGDPETGEILP